METGEYRDRALDMDSTAGLQEEQVRAAVEAVRPVFAKEGWSLELHGIGHRFLYVRLDHGRYQGVVPWVLRQLERELMSRLPEMRGVVLT